MTTNESVVSHAEKKLSALENEKMPIKHLVTSLLSPSTMPHIITMVLLCCILYATALSDSLIESAAIFFIGLSLGYCITAVASKYDSIAKLITLSDETELPDKFWLKTMVRFKICIIPLVSALLIVVLLTLLMGEDGAMSGTSQYFPLVLGSLFVVWSSVQGSSFTKWASTISTSQNTSNNSKNPMQTAISGGIIIGIFALVATTAFYMIDGSKDSIGQAMFHSIPFVITTLLIYASAGNYWNWTSKKLAAVNPRLGKFSSRWTTICFLFITWHSLTIWRQIFMDPNQVQIFLEELSLMIFTVFIAIWSMTNKGYNSKLNLIDENNALFWGLAFGYAYAGSVAMLSNVFDNIETVMQLGHFVVIITVIWLHRKLLKDVIQVQEDSVDVQRIVNSTKTEKNDKQEVVEEDDEAEWQEDTDVDWDAREDKTVGQDVDWEDDLEVVD